jgi:hypothetical protein
MTPLFGWLLPPLVGALIGYVTNAVAIKMLFRPLKAVFVLGIRVPFTPGILPRQRQKLADSIGAMVERELFTAEIVQARLRHPEVQEHIRESVARYTEKILVSPLGRIAPAGPEADAQGLIPRLARDFSKSPAFDSLLQSLFDSLAAAGENRTLRDIVGNDAALAHAVEGILRGGAGFLVPALRDAFTRNSEQAGVVLLDSFLRFLKREDVRRELETHGRVFLNKTVLKLNVLQRLVISAGQYDRTLHERMPEIIDDLIGELEGMARDGDITRRLGAFLAEQGRVFVSGGEFSGEFTRILGPLLFGCLDRPLGELVRRLTSGESFGENIRSRLRETDGPRLVIGRALEDFFAAHREQRLGELFSVDAEKKKAIDALLGDAVCLLMDEHLEALLGSINIQKLVADRINSLDMLRVEGIVLDVMASQLTWINVFGAILGALIGVFQTLFSRFILP